MKYFWATIRHKWFVLLASFKVGLPLWRALIHDWSKFTGAELPHYDRQFFGDKGDEPGFARAWVHHQNANAHHWEYWITRSDHSHGKSMAQDGCLPMPPVCVREMVADWMGASMAYTGSWDMTEWLKANAGKIKAHSLTLDELEHCLWGIGYDVRFNRPAQSCSVRKL